MTAEQPIPTGHALMADARAVYEAYRLLSVKLMAAIHDGEWRVGDGGYGALPSMCTRDSDRGYAFVLRRSVRLDRSVDRIAVAQAAIEVLEEAGLSVSGGLESEDGRGSIIANGEGYERISVSMHPSGGTTIAITTSCRPGSSSELGQLIIENSRERASRGELPFMFYPRSESPGDEPMFVVTADMSVQPEYVENQSTSGGGCDDRTP